MKCIAYSKKMFQKIVRYFVKEEQMWRCVMGSLSVHAFLLFIMFFTTGSHGGEAMNPVIEVQFTAQGEPAPEKPEEPPPSEQKKDNEQKEPDEPKDTSPQPLPVDLPTPKTEDTSPSTEELEKTAEKFLEENQTPPEDKNPALNDDKDLDSLAEKQAKIWDAMKRRQKRMSELPNRGYDKQTVVDMRKNQKQILAEKKGGGKITEEAVALALDWLERHQSSDGRWDCDQFTNCCKEQKCGDQGTAWGDPAVTGFALLAFLGAGYVPQEGKYNDVISKGFDFLIKIQSSDGCFGDKTGCYMYNHAIATMSMAEVCIFSNKSQYRESASQAVKFLENAQNPGYAWRYSYRCGDNDTSVTGWCMLALKAALIAEIPVNKATISSGRHWIDSVTVNGEEPWVGYTSPSPRNCCMTAVGICCRVLFPQSNDRCYVLGGAAILRKALPAWNESNDYYYWYYGTMAMYQVGGEAWTQWNTSLKSALIQNQEKIGCRRGSWGKGKHSGGRAYCTAINALSLEVYYRYPRIFK